MVLAGCVEAGSNNPRQAPYDMKSRDGATGYPTKGKLMTNSDPGPKMDLQK